ncbi:MAG: MASE1 domain-containing protein [Gallionella sp.]
MTSISNYRPGLSDLSRLAGVAIAYALTAKVMLGFFSANGIVSIVWPPSGLALAALLMGGKKYWPGVFAGALLGNVMAGSPVTVSFFIAIGNTLEALTCIRLLEYRGSFDATFNDAFNYWKLVFSATIGACVSALFGCTTLLLVHILNWGAFLHNLLTWWRGDFLGIILITPLLLIWRNLPRDWFDSLKAIESVVFLTLVFLCGQIVFLDWLHESVGLIARGYWMFLFVAWGAVRFGHHGVTLVIGMVAVQALLGATQHTGDFAADIDETGLSNFWFYMLIQTVVGIPLASYLAQRKNAEQALKMNEAKLKDAQRMAQIGSWELDLASNKLIWSDEIFNIFEIDRTRFAESYDAFIAAIHPEDREAVNQAYTQSLKMRTPYRIDHRLLMPDGRIKMVQEQCATFFTSEGTPLRSVGTLQDITERKTAEQAIKSAFQYSRSLIEASLDPLVTISADGKVTDVNTASEQVTGINRASLIGSNFADYFTDPGKAREGYLRAFAQGYVSDYPLAIRHVSGKITDVLYNASVYRDTDGNVIGVLGVARDITERKRAEEELKRYKDHLEEQVQMRTAELVLARDAAEAANKAKSVFLTSISHELRTPLNAILGFSGLLRHDKQLSQEQRDNLDIINRSGEHLLTLINDVLEMSRIEAGRVVLSSAPLDLCSLVRDVADMMHMRAQEKGLQLLVEQSSEVPCYIKGDEARLRQILINLVGNAVKFTQQGVVTMRFGIKPHDTQHRLLIEIEDTGIGISSEDQQRLFKPFVQLAKLAGDNKGTGLGLTITRQFVQLMGGSVSVESTQGKGSTFRVELPVEKIEAGDVSGLDKVERGEIVGLAPDQPTYRILIVEDQLENQLLLSQLMNRLGFAVKVAENGEQGVQLFQSWQPHLIWMDRRMPVMDGLEAARRIRELPGGTEVKIIAVTASAFTEQRDEMPAAGMDDFVRKPYRASELYECLTRQLGVRYIYAGVQERDETEPAVALTSEMLAVLPSDLRRELNDALVSLESERIAAAIAQVASLDPKLHKMISRLAGNYDYPAILKALQTN